MVPRGHYHTMHPSSCRFATVRFVWLRLAKNHLIWLKIESTTSWLVQFQRHIEKSRFGHRRLFQPCKLQAPRKNAHESTITATLSVTDNDDSPISVSGAIDNTRDFSRMKLKFLAVIAAQKFSFYTRSDPNWQIPMQSIWYCVIGKWLSKRSGERLASWQQSLDVKRIDMVSLAWEWS